MSKSKIPLKVGKTIPATMTKNEDGKATVCKAGPKQQQQVNTKTAANIIGNSESENFKNKLMDSEGIIEGMQKDLKVLADSNTLLTDKLNESEIKCSDLKKTIVKLEDRLGTVQDEKDSVLDALSAKENELYQWQEAYLELEQNCDQLEKQMQALEKRYTDETRHSKVDLMEVKRRYDLLYAEAEELRNKIDGTCDKLQTVAGDVYVLHYYVAQYKPPAEPTCSAAAAYAAIHSVNLNSPPDSSQTLGTHLLRAAATYGQAAHVSAGVPVIKAGNLSECCNDLHTKLQELMKKLCQMAEEIDKKQDQQMRLCAQATRALEDKRRYYETKMRDLQRMNNTMQVEIADLAGKKRHLSTQLLKCHNELMDAERQQRYLQIRLNRAHSAEADEGSVEAGAGVFEEEENLTIVLYREKCAELEATVEHMSSLISDQTGIMAVVQARETATLKNEIKKMREDEQTKLRHLEAEKGALNRQLVNKDHELLRLDNMIGLCRRVMRAHIAEVYVWPEYDVLLKDLLPEEEVVQP